MQWDTSDSDKVKAEWGGVNIIGKIIVKIITKIIVRIIVKISVKFMVKIIVILAKKWSKD